MAPRYRLLNRFWFLLLALALPRAAETAPHELGLPYYTEYRSERQVSNLSLTDFAFDRGGQLFIVNSGSLFLFDGRRWIPVVSESELNYDPINEIEAAPDGSLLSASIERWGRLQPIAPRAYTFSPIMPKFAAGEDQYPSIATLPNGRTFLYGDQGAVLLGPDDSRRMWTNAGKIDRLFSVGERSFACSSRHGLFEAQPDGDALLPAAPDGLSDWSLDLAISGPRDAWIVNKEDRRLYRFDGDTATPIATEIDALLAQGGDLSGARLPNGDLAICIRGQGIFVLRPDGALRQSLQRSHDRAFGSVLQVAVGPKGMLWALTNQSIVKIHLNAPITVFDERMDIYLHWGQIGRYQEKLYVRSEDRLYLARYYESGAFRGFERWAPPGFERVTAFASYRGGALASDGRDLYDLPDGEAPRLLAAGTPAQAAHILADQNRIIALVPTDSDLALFVREAGSWKELGPRLAFSGFVGNPQLDSYGNLWVERGLRRVLRIELAPDGLQAREYDMTGALPPEWVNLWTHGGQLYFSAGGKIVTPDAEGQFRETLDFQSILDADGPWKQRPTVNARGDILVVREHKLSLLRKTAAGYETDWITPALYDQSNTFIQAEGDIFWLISSKAISRFDPREPPPPYDLEPPRIIGLERLNEPGKNLLPVLEADATLPFHKSGLSVAFAIDDFHLREQARFQVMVEGVSRGWSRRFWEPLWDLHNLDGGDYRLRLRAVDHLGRVSPERVLSFSVAPPLFRSPVAFAMYTLAGATALGYAIQRYLSRQQRERERLEVLVTERTHKLNQALKDAEIANEAKSNFLANMSHELRTPLNAVLGATNLLSDTKLEDSQRAILKILQSSGSCLLNVISDILDFSKIQGGHLELERIEMSLSECVQNAIDVVKQQARKKGLELSYWMDEQSSYPIICDPYRIQQVLINLLNNAVKFTLSGEIRLTCEATPQRGGSVAIRFTVRDTGIGIAKEQREAVFQVFSQVDNSTTRRFGGTGLGLAICRNLASLMDGAIDFDSEPGKGASFFFTMRAKRAPGFPPTGYFRRKGAFAGKTARLLGFHPSTRATLSSGLQTLGMKIAAESDPTPDVALASSLVALDAAGSQLAQTPIIVISPPQEAHSRSKAARRIQRLDAPPHPKAVVAALEFALSPAPKAPPETPPPEPEEPPPAPQDNRDRRALIAEDNFSNQVVLAKMLDSLGYKAAIARDGAEAFGMWKTNDYPILLIDLHMPLMNGFEAIRRIRAERRPQPYIIVQTANVVPEQQADAMRAGADALLTKPISLERLREALAKAKPAT